MKCRHCQNLRVSRPRQLCWVCYYTLDIRMLYVSLSIYARKGVQQPSRVKPAAYPTRALPGSLEKILVMMERAELGQSLHHADDARLGGSRVQRLEERQAA